MADFNQQNTKKEFDFKPTYTVGSFSSYGGSDKYLAVDIWNSQIFFTFGDKSNPDKPIINKISISADKLTIIWRLLDNIANKRLNNMVNSTPYDTVEPINIEAYTNEANLPNAKVYISIQTTTVDGTERVSITGNINERSINIILANKTLANSTENADYEKSVDVEDAPLYRLINTLRTMPEQLGNYKRDLAFHRMNKFKSNNNNNNYNNNRSGVSYNARPNTDTTTVVMDEETSDGDVPF